MSTVKKSVFSAVLKLSKDGELRMEQGNRFHVPPDLRRRMHVRQTLFSFAELLGRYEQTTEFDLQKVAGSLLCYTL